MTHEQQAFEAFVHSMAVRDNKERFANNPLWTRWTLLDAYEAGTEWQPIDERYIIDEQMAAFKEAA